MCAFKSAEPWSKGTWILLRTEAESWSIHTDLAFQMCSIRCCNSAEMCNTILKETMWVRAMCNLSDSLKGMFQLVLEAGRGSWSCEGDSGPFCKWLECGMLAKGTCSQQVEPAQAGGQTCCLMFILCHYILEVCNFHFHFARITAQSLPWVSEETLNFGQFEQC